MTNAPQSDSVHRSVSFPHCSKNFLPSLSVFVHVSVCLPGVMCSPAQDFKAVWIPSGGKKPGADLRWHDHEVMSLTDTLLSPPSFVILLFSSSCALCVFASPSTSISQHILISVSPRASAAPSLCRCGTTSCAGSAVTSGLSFRRSTPKRCSAKCCPRRCRCWCRDTPGLDLHTRDTCRSGTGLCACSYLIGWQI